MIPTRTAAPSHAMLCHLITHHPACRKISPTPQGKAPFYHAIRHQPRPSAGIPRSLGNKGQKIKKKDFFDTDLLTFTELYFFVMESMCF